jgi:hypothetical protein
LTTSLVPALTNAAELFAELAASSDTTPRELLHRQLRYLADVMRGWLYDDLTEDERLLLRQNLSHVEAARDCIEVLLPSFSLTRLADVDDDEHDFETCVGCDACDDPIAFTPAVPWTLGKCHCGDTGRCCACSAAKELLSPFPPASVGGEKQTTSFAGAVGTNLTPLPVGRT